MNTSTQNALQSGQDNTESTSIVERSSDPNQQNNGDGAQDIQPDDEEPFTLPPPTPLKFAYLPLETPITSKELDVIKLTSQFVAVYGGYFRLNLEKSLLMKPQLEPHFRFMKMSNDISKLYFSSQLVQGYGRVLLLSQKMRNSAPSTATAPVLEGFFNLLSQILEKEENEQGVEIAMIDLHAFQFFANMEYNVRPLPKYMTSFTSHDVQPDTSIVTHDSEPIRFPLFPEGITHEELDTIKLTAQFVAVYGMGFGQGLMESLFTKPELEPYFQFMKSTDSRHCFYSELALGYMRVLRPSRTLKEKSTSKATLLEGFFNLFRQLLEKKEGAEMAMVDLHAFEYIANAENSHWSPLVPGFLSILKKPQPKMQPPPEEPEPKRQKLALVPEDQFLAQNPGSSTIRVSVPNFNDGQVIEITVQSLSENVASLKEKIANKLELSGKAGVLEDNKSLAHYNVGTGDILTLSL